MIAPDDLEHCREAIRHGSLSFHAASKLLPARVRDPALALYADQGFVQIGVRRNYYPAANQSREDAIVMRCALHAMRIRISDNGDE